MKKYFPFCVLVFFSLTTQAMERDSLEAFQEIAKRAFPLALYEAHKDGDINDKERLSRADQAARANPLIIPLEIFSHSIFPHLDSKALLEGVRLTCHSFYELSSLSFFCLNDYCLTETRPHDIPIPLLRFKTCNTKGGIFMLALLTSVSAEDLKNWFEPDFLQAAFLPCQNSLPVQLEGQSEEELGKLYLILKIALASPLVDTADASNPVIKLLKEYPYPYGLSLNKLRLLSLNPTRPGVYYETLEQLINSSQAYPLTPAPQAIDVVARELLMLGRNVVSINNRFFVHYKPRNAQKREIAIEILELCTEGLQFYRASNY